MAATQIDSLCPQVINAALTLAARPQSKVAQDNMDVFKDQWEKQVRVLTEAVDDITSVDDFLSVSGNHRKQAPYNEEVQPQWYKCRGMPWQEDEQALSASQLGRACRSMPLDSVFVMENHILEDVNKCVIALQEGDVDTLDRTAGAIRGRAARVIHIINAEMENYEAGVYTEKVLEATKLLSETGVDASQLHMLMEGLEYLSVLFFEFEFK
ncbi:Catenin alpha-2 [Saguinus oedipus]|uniref:Catenin alpha-2 n=1 Tax=Saguinus oedipus TaxID=9490 RepID=A0ABQ9U6R8_SAGOE|nr:Catenin alpha-2 [Saguinus oedipus]